MCIRDRYDNGWSYGYKVENVDGKSVSTAGFYPSSFVKPYEVQPVQQEGAHQDKEASEEESEEENEEEDDKHGPPEGIPEPEPRKIARTSNNFVDYAKQFLDEENILLQVRTEEFLKQKFAPTPSNQEGIIGYKTLKNSDVKFKHIPGSSIRAYSGDKIAIPIKDQSQVAKAYRQMSHYFDYDQWIEQRNANPPKKAKPDPSKKKEKKKVFKLD
eukprot:TRINITY_DN14272_c0_g1_i2.p1 TRINITY_DN14272_c0_g1~~TRINITY_DN14272_c0_g1_i2.p1  ORF type:complete len:233 (+),score=67.40 TRINITY_DN14272_c0_g1_i2:60-701(+)